jgi:hypothetical protein
MTTMNARRAPGAPEVAGFAGVRMRREVDMERYFWTIKEVKIVAEFYPAGGVSACLPLLANRTKGGVYQQARKLGLMFGDNKPRPRKLWETTKDLDRQIIDHYQTEIGKGSIKKFAARINRPYWWVKKRACVLGVARQVAGNKEIDWSDAEIRLLENHSYKHPDVIARIFRANGFKRTATAIVVKRKRLHCDTVDIENYTATQLAGEFGVDIKVITRWIEKGWLKASRRGTSRSKQQGGDMWWIKRKHVRDFVVESIGVVDIRKVDKIWFVDLLTN